MKMTPVKIELNRISGPIPPRWFRKFVIVLASLLIMLAHGRTAQAATVDIMLVYDTTAANWVSSNGGMGAFSQDAVSRMNQAVKNSGVGLTFRLVHSMSVAYTTTSGTTNSLSGDLSALQRGSGAFVAVHDARNTYGADLVAMLVDTGSSSGNVGLGYVLGSWSGSPAYAFTVTAVRSVAISHTLTHEVGHNLGAHHSKYQDQSPGPNTYLQNPSAPYSAGWYFTGTNGTRYHTIMAYYTDGTHWNYQSAPLFSTPLKSYQGTVAGCALDGDNARVIGLTMDTVALYRLNEPAKAGTPSWITVPASSSTGGFTVSWGSSSTGGVTYVLEEAGNASFTSGLRQAYSGTGTSASITGRSSGNTYYYRVKATKSGYTDSDWRTGGNGCTVSAQAAAPSSITVPGSSSTGDYTVSWGSSATGGVTYVLEEATSSSFTDNRRTAYSGTGISAPITGRSYGLTYYYRVKATRSDYTDSVWQTGGNGCVVTRPGPANDHFANAVPISGFNGRMTGNNTAATKETGEPNHAGNAGGTSVWWRWTAPSSGPVTMDTFGSDMDTLLAAYTGSSVIALTPVAYNDDAQGLQSRITFDAVGGTVYALAVDGYSGASGHITLNWDMGIGPGWVNVSGRVTYGGNPVCAMALANGQHMFTCSGDGSFDLNVPLDNKGQITLYVFCSGLSPFRRVMYPYEGRGMQIALEAAIPGRGMDVSCSIRLTDTRRARLSGAVYYNGSPVCAMVLANGQHMFTCSGDGSYLLDVPLDTHGGVTLFAFCSGLPPYRYDFTGDQIPSGARQPADDGSGSASSETFLFTFPHIAGLEGWSTEIALVNHDEVEATGTLRVKDSMGLDQETCSVVLPPGGRRQFVTGADDCLPRMEGYAVFETTSEKIVGYTKHFVPGRVRSAAPLLRRSSLEELYVAHILSTPDEWWTGIGIVNTTLQEKDLTLTFNDGSTRWFVLGPGEHEAFTIQSLFNGKEQPGLETARISGASGIVGLALFGSDAAQPRMGGISLSGETSTRLVFPHVVHDREWRTGVVIYNPSTTEEAALTLRYYNGEGELLDKVTPDPLPPQGRLVGPSDPPGFPEGTAWLRVDSTLPVTGLALFGTVHGAQMAGYSVVNIAGDQGVFPKLEKDGWTGIVLVNTEEGEAEVTLEAVEDDGTVAATAHCVMPGLSKKVNPAEMFFAPPADISRAGYIRYTSSRQMVGLQLNGAGDGTMLDALPALGGKR